MDTPSIHDHDANTYEHMRTWELSKIGSFDADSWYKILKNLGDEDLANAAVVCKDFQNIAETVFKKRYKVDDESKRNSRKEFYLSFARPGWKSVVSQFKSLITQICISGLCHSKKVQQEDFDCMTRYLSDTVKDICFVQMNTKQWRDVAVQRKFQTLEKLSFVASNVSVPCSLLHHLSHWCPNLTSLKLSSVNIGKSKFLEQSMPLLEDASFHNIISPGQDFNFFLVFIIKNRQLKHLFADLSTFPAAPVMSCLPIVNEVLTNLETLTWAKPILSLVPTFRKNFPYLKSLTLISLETYKNEMLSIIQYFPVLEKLELFLITKNLMSNADLIDLLTQSSYTLKKLIFSSRSENQEMKFGYDLLRSVCVATSNRNDILVEFEFGMYQFDIKLDEKYLVITKNWIKKNGKFIVLEDDN